MSKFVKWWPALLLGVVLATGCGRQGPEGRPDSGPAGADGAKYLLNKEPAGAKGVLEVRKRAGDGDEVVVVGRIGGGEKPWVEGRAAFWIVDPSLKPCGDDEGCPTPWDYCCEEKESLLRATATVKVTDGEGRTVPEDARKLLGLKELQTVVVKGRAKRDETGNLTVLADGVYVRP
jgi:hypothetical protein